jgi:hypothetical protein
MPRDSSSANVNASASLERDGRRLPVPRERFRTPVRDERFQNRPPTGGRRYNRAHDPFVEAAVRPAPGSTPRYRAHARRGRIRRIEPTSSGAARERFEHARRAATRVLVLMEPQSVVESMACRRRSERTDRFGVRGQSFGPRGAAIVGRSREAGPRQPLTDITRVKSAALQTAAKTGGAEVGSGISTWSRNRRPPAPYRPMKTAPRLAPLRGRPRHDQVFRSDAVGETSPART